MIIGYILADSGGTPIIIREYVPVLTKEGRNFFAQISSVMYSFVEGLVHSRLRHVETESIHLYFASSENFIFTLFSDSEEEGLEDLAERIILEIERFGYDPIQLQIDETIQAEVMDLIDRYLRVPPPDIKLVKDVLVKVKGLIGHGRVRKIDLVPPPEKPRQIDIENIRPKKTAFADVQSVLKNIEELDYKNSLSKLVLLLDGESDTWKALFVKLALMLMESDQPEMINPDALRKMINSIKDIFLQRLLELEIDEFSNILSSMNRSKLMLTNKTVVKSYITRDLEDSIAYILVASPPVDVELARMYAKLLPERSLLHSLYRSYEITYHILYSYQLPSDTWLYYIGDLQYKVTKDYQNKKFDEVVLWLRSWATTLSVAYTQQKIGIEEIKEILKLFVVGWKNWKKALDKAQKVPIALKAETYLRYLEILRLLSIITAKDLLSKEWKEIIGWTRRLNKYRFLGKIKSLDYALLMSWMVSFIAEILTKRDEASIEVIEQLDDIVNEDVWTLWNLSPALFATYYSNILWALIQLAKVIKLKTVSRELLESIIEELEKIREALKGYPVIYWLITLRLVQSLTLLEVKEALEKISEIRKEAEEAGMRALCEMIDKITEHFRERLQKSIGA